MQQTPCDMQNATCNGTDTQHRTTCSAQHGSSACKAPCAMYSMQDARSGIGHATCNMQHTDADAVCNMKQHTSLPTAQHTVSLPRCQQPILGQIRSTPTAPCRHDIPCRPCDRRHGILCRMGHRAPCVGDMPGGSVSLQHGLGPTDGELGGEDRHVTDLLVLHRPRELLRPTQVLQPNIGRSCGA